MTIAELRELSNRAIYRIPKDILVVLLVLLASSASFGLGMLAERQNREGRGSDFKIETITPVVASGSSQVTGTVAGISAESPSVKATGAYVASKNGETYYLATCKASERIKAENRVWFDTVEEARASGRRPAANCPGL